MQLGAAMSGPGQATPSEYTHIHLKIPAILLRHDVGGYFRRSEDGMFGMVQGELFIDAIYIIRVLLVDLPAGLFFFQRKEIGVIAIYLIGGGKDEYGLGCV